MNNLRDKIDQLDDQIMELLNQRFNVVKDVKKFKKENNIAVMDLKREESIINKTRKFENSYHVEDVYKTILKVSKEIQK